AVSNIKPEYIQERLGTQEFPEILKTTPSVYATKQGGGYGDSRINLRGFNSRNVGVLINGVPVNDMENGYVYWSNWAGLSDVTRSMQVQRGIGASRLAISSVGGTINILTKTTDMKKGGVVYFGLGNNNYNKTAFTVSTGMLNNGWAVTVSGSHTTGDGYVEETDFDAYSYYFNASKRFSSKNQISFNIFGAPQWHDQRANKRPIEEYRNDPDGIKMNWDYGYRNGQKFNGDHAHNYYHKPVASFNHFWTISSDLSLSTVAYASFGRGGGRRIYGDDDDLLSFEYPSGMPTDNTLLTDDGYLNYDSVVAINGSSMTGSKAIVASSFNSHDWYGVLSTLKADFGNITFTGGYDGRYYKGYHYMIIDDLLGGDYFLNSGNVNRDAGTPLYKGDKVNYYNTGEVLWNGLFSQVEYSDDNLSAFVSAAVSYSSNRRIDEFQYTPEDTMPGQVSAWKSFLTYSFKGGVNYNISDKLNVFANAGYFTRPPFMKFVFKGYTNEFNDSVKVERVLSFETGIGYRTGILRTSLYGYYTKWLDKSVTRSLGNTTANITGLNALHKGIEWVAKIRPVQNMNIGLMVSVGDWKWEDDVIADIYDEDQNLIGTEYIYAAGLHRSDAAQTTGAITFDYEILPDLRIGADWTYYDRLYARFDVEERAAEESQGIDSWLMPSYNLMDFNFSYYFEFGDYDAALYGKINNFFDTEYIADGLDGSNHDAASSYVYYGFGRTWSVALRIKF
ncbi:MAG: TonB-dependent receptor plug domain-containing protein, partial [Bacteroidota bacterium]|nr:TonB-dependent receptor plug domain-containing protein [Bacteroidota bacterium]